MPINVLPKKFPRGRGPEPSNPLLEVKSGIQEKDEALKEADLAAQEIQDLWESQEIGITGLSGQTGHRYSDPN